MDQFPITKWSANGFAGLTLHRIGMARQADPRCRLHLPMVTSARAVVHGGICAGHHEFHDRSGGESRGAHKLIDLCTRVIIDWLKAQQKVMAIRSRASSSSTTFVGFINEEHYLEFAHPI